MAKDNSFILKIDGLCVHYGHIQALADVSIQVEKGDLVALIGANGSGKSTMLKAIVGLQRAGRGTILFVQTNITWMSTENIVALGIVLVPEGRGILAGMTVSENLELGAYHCKTDIRKGFESVFHRFPVLRMRMTQLAGTLSGGEQQILAIGRAILSSPKLLMMDEPSLGLAPIMVNTVFNTILDLKKEGYTILLSEQNAHKALQSADRGYVLEMGRVLLEGTRQELTNNLIVRQAYLAEAT